MNLHTEISSWFTTDSHQRTLSSTRLIILVRFFIGNSEVGAGFADCPLSEIPHCATDEELVACPAYQRILAEATQKAQKQMDILREGMRVG